MKKYWLVHVSVLLLLLLASYLSWETPFHHTVQVIGLVVALALAIILLHVIRDKFLREVKASDIAVYERMAHLSHCDKSYGLNIEKDYPYSGEIQDLIHWWSNYTWLTLATIAIPFILLVLSDG